MAKCDVCGSVIIFGGVRDGEFRFCSKKCQANSYLLKFAAQIPREVIQEHVRAIHAGPCPKCGATGPVDIHYSYSIYSLLIMTSWKTNQLIACNRCGLKAKLGNLVSSFFLGWWALAGLFLTPVQIYKNIRSLMLSVDPYAPSDRLEKVVRLSLARSYAEELASQQDLQEG